MAFNIRLRNDTRQHWLEQNPILAQGEMGIEFQDNSDKVKIKVGNGESDYKALPYFNDPISYTNIDDKPTLNGISIDGDKNLADYGIQAIGSYMTMETVNELLEVKANKDDTYNKSEIDSLFNSLLKLPEVGNNTNKFLKLDNNGKLYWSAISESIYTKDEVDNLLSSKVSKEEGKALISTIEIDRLANVANYDDTEVKNDIVNLKKDVTEKLTKDDLANYVTADSLEQSLDRYALSSDIVSKANASELYSHISNKSNPHNVTLKQLGIENINNTSDLDKPISTAMQEALDEKQNSFEVGFGLLLEDSVLKNTNPNVNADWNAEDGDSYILNKPSLSTVALSNDYNDLDNLPEIPEEYELPIASDETLGGIKLGIDLYLDSENRLNVNYPEQLTDYAFCSHKPSLLVTDENNVERAYEFIPGMTKRDLDIAGYNETQSALNLKADVATTYSITEVDNLIENVQMGATSWGLIQGSISSQKDLKYQLDAKANANELATVAYSGSYDDLKATPYIPQNTSDLTNDSDYTTNAILNNSISQLDNTVVHIEGDETITGNKTFTGTVSFTETINGTAINAMWADVAELYVSDKEYPIGTLIQFGGEKEITIAKTEANGVISEKPAIIINSEAEGQPVVLGGKTRIRVIGKVKKGDKLYLSSTFGCAQCGVSIQNPIAISLENNDLEEEKLVMCVTKLSF